MTNPDDAEILEFDPAREATVEVSADVEARTLHARIGLPIRRRLAPCPKCGGPRSRFAVEAFVVISIDTRTGKREVEHVNDATIPLCLACVAGDA